MKALLHTAPYQLDYTEVADPGFGPRDVRIRVEACGICGSDVKGYTGTTGRRIPPLIMGHEASGTVEAVGAEVEGIGPGDRVCFDSTVYCNACEACRRGQYNRCINREVLGVSLPKQKRHGAFAELVSLPSWVVLPLPEHLSFVQAAMLEPVSIGLHAVNRGQVEEGDTVVVFGAGPIGLFILQAALHKGARQVVMVDLKRSRRELATALGAAHTLNPVDGDLVTAISELTDGEGANVSFEAVGIETTVQQAVNVVGTGGRVTLVGNLVPSAAFDLQKVVTKELTLRGSYASSGEYPTALGLVASGAIDVMPLVSEVLPLSEGQRAFDRLFAGEEPLMKIILEPQSNGVT